MAQKLAVSQALKWHGGKGYLAKQIVALMPPHTRYCEPFFGGGAVLFAKNPEGVAEFVNDLDGALTNFWKVLRDDQCFARFERLAALTPFSQVEYEAASYSAGGNGDGNSSVHNALGFFIRNRQSRQALGRDYATPTSRTRRGMNENVSAWLSAVDGLPEVHERLRRVEIRCMEAVEFIKELDSEQTCFYCDPPYMAETRFNGGGEYAHEMTPLQHSALLIQLSDINGKFLLSGYPSAMYEAARERYGWHHVDFSIDNKASGKKVKEKKIERVWANFPLRGNGLL